MKWHQSYLWPKFLLYLYSFPVAFVTVDGVLTCVCIVVSRLNGDCTRLSFLSWLILILGDVFLLAPNWGCCRTDPWFSCWEDHHSADVHTTHLYRLACVVECVDHLQDTVALRSFQVSLLCLQDIEMNLILKSLLQLEWGYYWLLLATPWLLANVIESPCGFWKC